MLAALRAAVEGVVDQYAERTFDASNFNDRLWEIELDKAFPTLIADLKTSLSAVQANWRDLMLLKNQSPNHGTERAQENTLENDQESDEENLLVELPMIDAIDSSDEETVAPAPKSVKKIVIKEMKTTIKQTKRLNYRPVSTRQIKKEKL